MSSLEGPNQEFGLARLDGLGDAEELRAQAKKMTRLARSTGLPEERPEGADGSGSIRVVVDAGGGVHDVVIDRRWRGRLRSENFADALFAAFTAALRKALSAAVLETLAADQPSGRSPDEGTPWTGADEEWLTATRLELDDVFAELGRIEELERKADTRARQERTLSSPRGYLTVRIRGGVVVGVTGDVRRIRRAEASQLAQEAAAVLRAATQSIDR